MFITKSSTKIIKYVGLATVSSGVIWVTVEIKKSRDIVKQAIDYDIIHLVEQKYNEQRKAPLKIDAARWIPYEQNDNSFIYRAWKRLKFEYARKLVSLASSDNYLVRNKALRYLAAVKNLDSWQYSMLAERCNARTLTGLARTEGVDMRYFLDSRVMNCNLNHEAFIKVLQDFLIHLQNTSNHPCLRDFISKTFTDEQDSGRVLEHYCDDSEPLPSKYSMTSLEHMLPLCLESLLHHTNVERYSKDVVQHNGLHLLMGVYNRYKNNCDIKVTLCTILANISIHRDLLNDLHETGWISLLARWVRDRDLRLSVTAAVALENLDTDGKYKYGRGIYSLHPIMKTESRPKVDVVFIHGLLGGVFYTWRQRRKGECSIDAAELLPTEVFDTKKYSDPTFREYLETVGEQKQLEWDDVGSDFEIVSFDIPTYCSTNANDEAFTCNKYDKLCRKHDKTTQCWPKDWLTEDCPNLRVIGVNYNTSLSMWATTCPELRTKTYLEDRSNELMRKLKAAGIGTRPIVWITHSMGGLIVKNILCKASESDDVNLKNLHTKTRGIVFYSTPHNGSKIANLNQPTSLVVLPSVEVQELREESPQLRAIHSKFLDVFKNLPVKIVTFMETKSTVVTAMKFNFLMVEPHSGNPGVGEYFEVPQDHLGICKPSNRESFLYQKVLHVIKNVVKESYEFQFFTGKFTR